MTVTYRPADSVARIARKLIDTLHTDLADVRVEYVFRSEHAKSNGKAVMGKCRKISGLNAYLAQPVDPDEVPAGDEVDFFVIEIAEDIWAALDGHQRTALVDHELSHATISVSDKAELSLVMVPHDLEEFRHIVERYGLWQPDLEAFAESVKGAPAQPGSASAAAEQLRTSIAEMGGGSVSGGGRTVTIPACTDDSGEAA